MSAPIHFAHGNGFPARCYSTLLDALDAPRITYIDRMGHGPWQADGDLRPLTEELLTDIERQHDEPVVGLGHSTGGMMMLLAASRRPELFRDLVLLDPMLLCATKRLTLRLFRRIGLGDYLGPTRVALRRKTQYGDRDEMRRRLRDKPLFRAFAPQAFEDFLEHAFVANPDGHELRFTKDVEVAIFRSTQAKVPGNIFGLRGLMLYGEHSHLLRSVDVSWWRRRMTGFTIEPRGGGHLFPFEDPEGLARRVRQRLAELESS